MAGRSERGLDRKTKVFRRVKILLGNIGYLVMERFQRLDWAEQRAISILNDIAKVAALTIDLQ